jgi:hypothetical protein
MRRLVLLMATALFLSGCDSPSDVPVDIIGSGNIQVQAYLDENGDGVRTAIDSPVAGLPLLVRFWNSLNPVDQGTTDAMGQLRLPRVGVGTMRVDPSPSFLGDTLEIVQPPANPFTVRPDTLVVLTVGLGYPFVPFDRVRSLPEGRRVFTSGIALNGRENFGDGEVHLRLDTLAIRATRVDRVGVTPGDSVRIVGRTRLVEGRMTLDSARIFVLAGSVTLVPPLDFTTGEAATARSGTRDAQLVRVQEALVTSARMEGTTRVLTVNDGSGPVDLVVRDYLQLDATLLVQGSTVVRGTGLLRPAPGSGGSRYRVFPRGAGDLFLRAAPPPPAGG